MKKKINKQLTLYFTNFYPYQNKIKSYFKYTIMLGIGGNIGNTKKIFYRLFLSLNTNDYFHITQTSFLLKNPPFGYTKQDDFLNSLIILQTNLSPLKLLDKMQKYEKRFGRIRSFKDAPRTLDIDIIFIKKYSKFLNINHKRLIVPHLHWHKRDSIKIPLKSFKNQVAI
jgi:2-amino-4-hydroxy-6-hydroxymethyldihydropteridine diphosphokinase